MDKMKFISPTKISLPSDGADVKRFLTITDRQIQFQIKRMRENVYWRSRDPEGFEEAIEKLKVKLHPTLIFYEDGKPSTYSGLWKELEQRFGWKLEGLDYSDIKTRSIPWAVVPPEMRQYQKEALDALITAKHGALSCPTGSGKSLILLNLCKAFPVKTIIMTPSAAITDQLYRDFQKFFGKKYVGKYGDGRKDYDKLFTIGVAQSLTLIKPDTEAYEELSKAEQLLADESHTIAAETFEKISMDLAAKAKLRFFVSATQLRTDGCEMILKGITGPIVYAKEFKELVAEGYLKKPIFKLFSVPRYGMASESADPKTETRKQLYGNSNVNKLAADIAQKAVTLANRPTVIIIEEFKQFMALKNYLGIPFEFVHGGASSKDVKEFLPEEYWKCDVEKSVKNFNEGKTKLLIGTSAISTGVDLKPVGCLIYLQGGTSEIKVRQAIGRGTRIVPELKDFWVVDFCVKDSATLERHFQSRLEIYHNMSDEVNIYG